MGGPVLFTGLCNAMQLLLVDIFILLGTVALHPCTESSAVNNFNFGKKLMMVGNC